MFFFVYVLDVHKKQVCYFHELLEFGEPLPFFCKAGTGGIYTGINVTLFTLGKELNQKIQLEQRFSAADCNAACIPPVGAVSFRFLQKFID